LLEQATELLPVETSLSLWTEELGLVGKMLARDSRNFHGWGYRRIVVSNVETLQQQSMAKQEFDYTTKMIKLNLSNFSAWHNRSKLILRTLEEQEASNVERKKMLDEGTWPAARTKPLTDTIAELDLIHKALFDPYDQSLWFYHQNLMCTFDPKTAASTLAPHLTTQQRKEYVAEERAFVEELLEDTDDCKWVYQALVELAFLEERIDGEMSGQAREKVKTHIDKLMILDPLRKGRWADLMQSVS
jgi:geranylgeranyl transferase type-2 subunit alpha